MKVGDLVLDGLGCTGIITKTGNLGVEHIEVVYVEMIICPASNSKNLKKYSGWYRPMDLTLINQSNDGYCSKKIK